MRIVQQLVELFCLAAVVAHGATAGETWKAGLAEVRITPRESAWMAGYAARTKPSEGVAQDLYCNVLALADQRGKRAVLVTLDLRRITADLSNKIASRVRKEWGLDRDAILINTSHTHSGPLISEPAAIIPYPIDERQMAAVDAYTRWLEDQIVLAIGQALKNLAPARLSFIKTEAEFARNRRDQFGGGPVDHEVPCLRISDRRGALRAVVFGYACHNTTIGPDFYKFHGDYAGSAKASLKSRYPGSSALFLTGCAGDANPHPRNSEELARQHGDALAEAVGRSMDSAPLTEIRGPLKCIFAEVPLSFAPPPTSNELQQRLQDKNAYIRRHAEYLLQILKRDGRLPATYPYPLQVWQFSSDLTLIAMGGEVVADYALRLKKELGAEKLWVAAYSNDVFGYVPSLRVLKEGGYEGGDAMIYQGLPGPFASTVEEMIIAKLHQLVRSVRKE